MDALRLSPFLLLAIVLAVRCTACQISRESAKDTPCFSWFCLFLAAFVLIENGYSGENGDFNPSDCRKVLFESPDQTFVVRKKIGIITSLNPLRMKWWGDKVDFKVYEDVKVDEGAQVEECTKVQVGDRLAITVSFDKKESRVLSILTLRLLPPAEGRPYDDEQLAREMQELRKIDINEL